MAFSFVRDKSGQKKQKSAGSTLKKVLMRLKANIVHQAARDLEARLNQKGTPVEKNHIDGIIRTERAIIDKAAEDMANRPDAEKAIMEQLVERLSQKVTLQPAEEKGGDDGAEGVAMPTVKIEVEEPAISSQLKEKLLSNQSEEDKFSPEFKSRLDEDRKRQEAQTQRIGASIKPTTDSNRYMVPFGFVAPMLKDMSEQKIIEKVQELYHIPFDSGDQARKDVDSRYPLIPPHPEKGERVYAWAYIHWNPQRKELNYEVIEPVLTPSERNMLRRIEDKLEEKLDVVFIPDQLHKHTEYLHKKIQDIIDLYGFKISKDLSEKLNYYITRDFVGLERIEPLMNDADIEDISCDGFNIPIYVFHRNPTYGQLKTNISFASKEEIDSFVIKLAQKCGKNISVAQPLLDATLPEGSRLQATLGSDIARRGSNFTIRKFTREPLTPTKLLEFGSANPLLLAYLWMCIEYGKSILVTGSTATGKTSALNAISLFIRPELKVVSIEDTAELTLPHPNWVPQVARPGYGEPSYGAVEMFDLLKASLRQRPDYMIVGEVRGAEASVMFQGMATGHPALATIHASSLQGLIDRLTTPPIDLSPALLENLDIILFLEKTKIKGRFVRRVKEINESMGVNVKARKIIPNKMFEWDPVKDVINMTGKSIMLQKIADFRGIDYQTVFKELERRSLFLEWLAMKKIMDYKNFSQWMRFYYSDPEKAMETVMRDARRKIEQKDNQGSP